VVLLGHEGFFYSESLQSYDNLRLSLNIFSWLSQTQQVTSSVITTVSTERTLLFDDFEDGDLKGWTAINGDWKVLNGELAQTHESSWPVVIWAGDKSWTDYVLEARVRT